MLVHLRFLRGFWKHHFGDWHNTAFGWFSTSTPSAYPRTRAAWSIEGSSLHPQQSVRVRDSVPSLEKLRHILNSHFICQNTENAFFRHLCRVLNKFHLSISGVLFFQLLSCVAFFALTLFSLNQADAIDSQVLIDLQDVLMYLCLCYVYSHFAENICAKSASLANVIYCTNWYEMPIVEQKIIILMIARSQKEYRFQGYGLVYCSLGNFLAVCKRLLSIRFGSIQIVFACMKIVSDNPCIDIVLFGGSYAGLMEPICQHEITFYKLFKAATKHTSTIILAGYDFVVSEHSFIFLLQHSVEMLS